MAQFNPDEYIAKMTKAQSDFDPDAYIQKLMASSKSDKPQYDPTSFMLDKAKEQAGNAVENIDKYSGAGAARAALKAGAEGQGLIGSIKAGASQYGKPGAPTGKDVAKAFGVDETSLSESAPQFFQNVPVSLGPIDINSVGLTKGGPLDLSKQDVAGGLITAAADPTNIAPVGEMAALGTKGALKGAEATGLVAKKIASPAIKAAEPAINVGKKAIEFGKETMQKHPILASAAGSLLAGGLRESGLKHGLEMAGAVTALSSPLVREQLIKLPGASRDALFKMISTDEGKQALGLILRAEKAKETEDQDNQQEKLP